MKKSAILNPILGLLCAFSLISPDGAAAILHPPPPDGGKEIVYAELKDMVENPGVVLGGRRAPDFLPVPLKEVALSDPHQSYWLGLNELAEGKLLSKARPVYWRYLVLHGQKAVAEVNLNADENRGPLRFSSMSAEDPLSDATFVALRKAEKLEQVKTKDYQLRLLNAPHPLDFVALWLQRDSEDILIPLRSFNKDLEVNRAYSEADVIKILKPIAEKKIQSIKKTGPNVVGG